MNCLVRQVEQERSLSLLANEVERIVGEHIGDVAYSGDALAVDIDGVLVVPPLAHEATPVVPAGTRVIELAQVPFADVTGAIPSLLKVLPKGGRLVMIELPPFLVRDHSVPMGVHAGQEPRPRRCTQRMGGEGVGKMRSFAAKDWLLIGVAGILLSGHFVFWIEALYFTTVSSASVLVASSPIILAILSYFILKERLSPVVLLAVVAGVLGAGVLSIGDRAVAETVVRNPALGNAMAMTAACLFSIYFVIGRIVRQKASWLGYVGPLYLVVAVTTIVISVARDAPLLGFEPKIYVLCAVMAIGPQIVGHGSFNYAVKYFSPTLLGLSGLMEPVGATLYALLLFGELPTPLSFLGAAILLVSVAVALVATGQKVIDKSTT